MSYFVLKNVQFWVIIPVAALGAFLRYEAVYFFLLCMTGLTLLNGALYSDSILMNFAKLKTAVRSRRQQVFKFLAVVVAFLAASATSNLLLEGAPSQFDVLNVYSSGKVNYYPASSHIFVQCYAILLYLKSFFLPVHVSFFGPWTHWIAIHNSTSYQLSLVLILALIFCISLGIVVRKQLNQKIKILALGLALFIVFSAVTSARIRHNWYFPSRAFLGSMFLMLAIFLASGPKLRGLLAGISLFAFVYTALFHYRSEKIFYNWESNYSLGQHPGVVRAQMNLLGASPEALLSKSFSIYQTIKPQSLIEESMVARKFWLQALFDGYFAAREVGNKTAEAGSIKLLKRSDSYLSTIALIESGAFKSLQEIGDDRRAHFCRAVLSRKSSDHKKFARAKAIASECFER
jgi:hypothetical protein